MNAELGVALNKLAKWRSVFAGWQLGSRSKEDPECQAVRDHREVTLLLRAEQSALVGLLIARGVFTVADWEAALLREAQLLDKDMEAKFPGVSTSDIGVHFGPEAAKTMKDWRP